VTVTIRNITLSSALATSSLVWASVFAGGLVLLQFLPESWHRLLWYDRAAVTAGDYWRILTGNLVHLDWAHLWLNVGALLIGIWIFHAARTPLAWLVAQFVCSLTTGLGLFVLSPDVAWCVGMSGALHGLLIIGALDWIREGDRMGAVLLGVWILKLGWEQWQGPMPFSAASLDSPVVTDAHLWGAAGGFLYAAGEVLLRRRRARL
jgi:rhomboid family GlyGly-CTERM serine protease